MTADETALWEALDASLETLCDLGAAGFWLRDDDAVAPSPPLDRLIGIAADAGVPLALAVIPAKAEPALAVRLTPLPGVSVLQHGLSHTDHAAPGSKKCELGPERPEDVVLSDLAKGRDRLAMFANVRPILVPPWNRIGDRIAARLPELGFAGLSLYGGRPKNTGVAGLLRVDTHLDPVNWRGDRGFVGRARALEMLLKRLRKLGSGEADRTEPTGILTHHLVHDEATFAFLADLFRAIGKHSRCRWHSAETLLGLRSLSEGGDAR